ncbi:hypothetical protein D3C78_1645570 [compost metagenome]
MLKGPAPASLPALLFSFPESWRLIAASLTIWPLLLSSPDAPTSIACCALTVPPTLLNVALLIVSAAPLSIRPPPALLSVPSTASVWSSPLLIMPLSLLSRLPASTFSLP